MNLTLFYNVSVKYQGILPINARQHIAMCEHPIDLVFVVCAEGVDQQLVAKTLQDSISNSIEIKTIHEQEAADRIGLNTTSDSKLRYDGYMLMQAAKLHADVITGRDNIIITDPDCLLLKPTRYFENDKQIVYYSDPRTKKYEKMGTEIFGNGYEFNYDFLNENSLVQKKILEPMRGFIGKALWKYSYRRHTWYDLLPDEYSELAGPDWPKEFESWESLPDFAKNEIIVERKRIPKLVKTEWFDEFSEYMTYGYYSMFYHPGKIVLKPIKIQNGPWGDGTADIFLNRRSEPNSLDSFQYVCYKNNVST
jgi:hypothetical protein